MGDKKKMPGVFLNILFGFVLIFFGSILITFITGHDPRGYVTVPGNKKVEFMGAASPVSEIAARFQPVVLLRETTPSPPLNWVWYEAVESESSLDLIYYMVWENEIHPNSTIHVLYSIFRAIYYGYPLYDIEYVMVRVDKASGQILKIRFETSPVNDFFVTISEHFTLEMVRAEEGRYELTWTNPEGQIVQRESSYTLNLDDHRPVLGAQTWNHLSTLVQPSEYQEYSIRIDAELKELSEEDFRKFKFVRKSQSEHVTEENQITAVFAWLTYALFVLLPGALLVFAGRRRRTKDHADR